MDNPYESRMSDICNQQDGQHYTSTRTQLWPIYVTLAWSLLLSVITPALGSNRNSPPDPVHVCLLIIYGTITTSVSIILGISLLCLTHGRTKLAAILVLTILSIVQVGTCRDVSGKIYPPRRKPQSVGWHVTPITKKGEEKHCRGQICVFGAENFGDQIK